MGKRQHGSRRRLRPYGWEYSTFNLKHNYLHHPGRTGNRRLYRNGKKTARQQAKRELLDSLLQKSPIRW